MPRTDSDAIEAVKARLDLVDIVRRYVDLKPAGERWSGVCPFHQETKPSFSVNPSLGFYYCFGCQATGDVIDFYGRINGLEFREALAELAREAGVPLGPSQGGDHRGTELRKACLEMHALTQEHFQRMLNGSQGGQAREYLARRGVDPAMIEVFGLGYAPDDWHGLEQDLQRHGFGKDVAVKAGLLSQNQKGNIYDRFRARIMFPIHDLSGRVIAFGGRVMDNSDPKYLNSSDTPIYKKGEHLYGLYQARTSITQTKSAILTEGYTDVISMVSHGFTNACGVLGTALTQDQIRRLAGFCRTVVLAFDGDRAGQDAALRSAEMILSGGLTCQVVTLPREEDIDSLLRGKGAQALRDLLEAAEDGLAFCLRMITKSFPPKEILRWATDFLKGLWDPSWLAYYLPKVAAGLELSEFELRRLLGSQTPKAVKSMASDRDILRCGSAQRDRDLLRFVVLNPGYVGRLAVLGMAQVLGSERARSFWEKLERHGVGEGLLPNLDEGEKRFFRHCQMEGVGPEDPEQVFEEYRELLERCRQEERRRELNEAIRQAQDQGDEHESFRLLKAYTDVRGEPHEQH